MPVSITSCTSLLGNIRKVGLAGILKEPRFFINLIHDGEYTVKAWLKPNKFHVWDDIFLSVYQAYTCLRPSSNLVAGL